MPSMPVKNNGSTARFRVVSVFSLAGWVIHYTCGTGFNVRRTASRELALQGGVVCFAFFCLSVFFSSYRHLVEIPLCNSTVDK
jgi:hypothetical protein